MKRNLLIATMFMAAASFASAQIYTPSTDILGAHLVGGRGCVACHTPHSGAFGNGLSVKGDAAEAGNVALWGEDFSPLLGTTITSGQSGRGTYTDTLPGTIATGASPDILGVMLCLSCHDGNLTSAAMMKGTTYEKLINSPWNSNSVPTLLGNDGSAPGNYLNDHPVGVNALISCNSNTAFVETGYNWDCNINSAGKIVPGPSMAAFIQNYGFFVKPTVIAGQPAVMCTTCHNQHSMNVVDVPATPTNSSLASGPETGLTAGTYKTMFFVIAPYNPNTTNPTANVNAQFCRQCHGGESNEMSGANIPTTF